MTTVNRTSHLATSDRSDSLSAEIGGQHFETSSKTGSNVGELRPQSFNPGRVYSCVSRGGGGGGGACQCGNSLFPFDRRDVPEAGRGLQQLGLPVHDRSVASLCGATPEALAAAKHPHALISSSVPAEEAGVDLGQKKDSYFYSCCHNN